VQGSEATRNAERDRHPQRVADDGDAGVVRRSRASEGRLWDLPAGGQITVTDTRGKIVAILDGL